ncbi:hypothetical protein [Desulfovibrio gilichinskyi]|uniref:Uncharacterized protein n=1 Tax=Desulfovibrio gilichinskyi TaxID=1519643 RepID=A0A1X7CHV0_9BACT|nr:hypothetical protein [Desulfovibrio gilichinskyi]SME96600.1 hypothetical protein SAMN06295933_0902 [Desulfovibrio gilichinskyi]
MEFGEAMGIASAVVVSFGGGAAIIAACSSWLGKIWADRLMEKEKARYNKDLEVLKNDLVQQTEDFKNNLIQQTESVKMKYQKSEILFRLELEAASAFIALSIKVNPRNDFPGKDWGEVCSETIQDFPRIEDMLLNYMSTWGAILSGEAKNEFDEALSLIFNHKFGDDTSSRTADEAVREFFERLDKVESIMKDQIRTQVTV